MTRIIGLLVGLVLAVLPTGLSAHSVSTAYVLITQIEENEYRVQVDVSILDVALSLPLDGNGDEEITWGEVQTVSAELMALAASGVKMERGRTACELHPEGLATRDHEGSVYLSLGYRATCIGNGTLSLAYDLFSDTDPDHRALVRTEAGGRAALYLAGGRQGTLEDISRVESSGFGRFFIEGMRHLAIGYDHMAFLLALLLPAGLAAAGNAWRPVGCIRDSLFHSATIVTCFTAAHSLTLAAAVLGWVRPDGRWIEVAIAASIIIAALANLRPRWVTHGWVFAFVFGLVHGFGFAGALAELGLPDDARAGALLAFNLGVEAGQLVVVLAVTPPLVLLARTSWYRRAGLQVLSLAIAALAVYWLAERL